MKVVSQRQSNAAFQRYEFRVQRTDISGATNAVPPGAPLAARRAFETGQERSARRRRAVNGRVLALHAVPRVGAGLICATSATGAGGGTGRSDVWETTRVNEHRISFGTRPATRQIALQARYCRVMQRQQAGFPELGLADQCRFCLDLHSDVRVLA